MKKINLVPSVKADIEGDEGLQVSNLKIKLRYVIKFHISLSLPPHFIFFITFLSITMAE